MTIKFDENFQSTIQITFLADVTHTGKYMVRATNAGGEAQSIADIAVYEPTPDTMVEVVKTVVFEDVRKHETLVSTELLPRTREAFEVVFSVSTCRSFLPTRLQQLTRNLRPHSLQWSRFIPNPWRLVKAFSLPDP